jgi:fucose permease
MTTNRYRKKLVFSAACMGMLLFGIVMISLGSILPEITEKFQLNETRTGNLITLLPGGILLGSLIFGPLVDWLSHKKILIAGSVFTAVGLEGIAFSEMLSLMHISVFCIGLGGGILNGVTNAIVSEISDEEHSANLSLLGVFFGVGALGTPVLLGLYQGIYSFESILAIMGALISIPIVLFIFIRFPKTNQIQGFPVREGLKMIKDPLLLLFGFMLFFQSGFEGLLNNWTTTYLEGIKNLSPANALFTLSSFVAALTVTRIILGKILRIFSPLKIMVGGFIIGFIGCIFLLYGQSFYSLITGLIAIGIGLSSGFPIIMGYVGQTYTHLSGTAFSIVITIALIGNVLANYSMGLISREFGYEVLPYLLMSTVVAICILIYITKKKYSKVIN